MIKINPIDSHQIMQKFHMPTRTIDTNNSIVKAETPIGIEASGSIGTKRDSIGTKEGFINQMEINKSGSIREEDPKTVEAITKKIRMEEEANEEKIRLN